MDDFLRQKLQGQIDSEKGLMIKFNPLSVLKALKWIRERLAVWRAKRIIQEIENPRE